MTRDAFKPFAEAMLAEIAKPRSFEETTFAIERLAQERLTPIDAKPVTILIGNPTYSIEPLLRDEIAAAPRVEAIREAMRQRIDALVTQALTGPAPPATVGTVTAETIEQKPRRNFCGFLSFDVTS